MNEENNNKEINFSDEETIQNESRITKNISDNFQQFWTIFAFEMKRNFVSRGFYVFLGLFIVLGIILSVVIGVTYENLLLEQSHEVIFEINSETWANYYSVNTTITNFVTMLVIFAAGYYGSKIVTGDLASGGLALIHSTTVRRESNLFARFLSAFVTIFILTLAGTIVLIVIVDIIPIITGEAVTLSAVLGFSILYFLRALFPLLLFTILITTICMFIGSVVKNPRLAIIGSMSFLVVYDQILTNTLSFIPQEWHLEYLSPSANLGLINNWLVGTVSGTSVVFEPCPWISLVIFTTISIFCLFVSMIRFKRMEY